MRYRRRFQQTIENLNAGQPFTLRLSGVQGLVTSISLMIRDLTTSVYNPLPIKSVDLLSPAGESLLGGTYTDAAAVYNNLIFGAQQEIHYGGSQLDLYVCRVPLSGANTAHAERRGHVESYVVMSGSHQLRFIPQLNTGALQVTVIYYCVGMLSIQNGQISTTVS
jgi:hypothetical protein